MTARYQYRLRGAAEEPINSKAAGNHALGLPPAHPTLPSLLRDAGYRTALIGKWHLGAMDFAKPCNRGFEYQYGFSEAYTLYADPKDKNIVNYKIPHQFMDAHQWKTAKGRMGNCAITKNSN